MRHLRLRQFEALGKIFYEKGYNQFVSKEAFECACNNTLEIADKCQSFKPNLDPKLPNIPNAEEELVRLTYAAYKEKGLDKDKRKWMSDGKEVTYSEQMKAELGRILEKGFASYFLMTRDLIKSATDKGYIIGPGRGSAAGSLVSYLLGIHELDPLKWSLSFGRFLSPSRGGNMLTCQMPKDPPKDKPKEKK